MSLNEFNDLHTELWALEKEIKELIAEGYTEGTDQIEEISIRQNQAQILRQRIEGLRSKVLQDLPRKETP